jgi:hypothetical protein
VGGSDGSLAGLAARPLVNSGGKLAAASRQLCGSLAVAVTACLLVTAAARRVPLWALGCNHDAPRRLDTALHGAGTRWPAITPAAPRCVWSRRQWIQLGFQQKDPASDLRGAGTHGRSTMRRSPQPAALAPTVAGIAGVRHLTCFLRSHAAEYRAAAAAGPDHCVALASLNLTLLLRAYLQLNREGETLQPICMGGNLRGSAEMRRRFLAWEQDTGQAFEQLHNQLLAFLLGR